MIREFMEREQDRNGLPVFFEVPENQPESQEGIPAILWRLELAADVPGVDYSTRFEVPVFRTTESSARCGAALDPTIPFQAAEQAWTPPRSSRIRVSTSEHGETGLYFPPARNAGLLIFLTVFTSIWTGILIVLWSRAPLIFGIVFGLFDVLLVLALAQMACHSARVVVGNGELTLHHRFLLIGSSWRIPADDIAAITPEIGLQSGSKPFYELKVTTRSGRKRGVESGIPDKRYAELLARTMRKAIGMKQGGSATRRPLRVEPDEQHQESGRGQHCRRGFWDDIDFDDR